MRLKNILNQMKKAVFIRHDEFINREARRNRKRERLNVLSLRAFSLTSSSESLSYSILGAGNDR